MNKAIKIYSFFVFVIFLLSMELWIGWEGRKIMMLILFGGGALLVKMMYNIPFNLSKRNIILVLLFYIAFLYRLNAGFAQFFTQMPSQLIPIICILCIADEYKEKILYYITKWYARLILFSLCVYFVVSFVPIPGLNNLEFASGVAYGSFSNYIVYVKSLYNVAEGGFIRFNGPFLEPGYVGMIGAFLLFANNFNFKKKESKIILLSVLFSMSLAGWMLAFIGYLLNLFYIGRIRMSRLVFSVLFIISFIYIGQSYNDGQNVINEAILSRLEYDEEKGFSGNNRNSSAITALALEIWSGNTEILLYGYPKRTFQQYEDYELIGSGFNHFLVYNGLVGVLLIFAFYIYTIITARDKKFALLFFIFVLFSFWQRSYALWFSWIICFYYSSVIADRTKYIKNKSL